MSIARAICGVVICKAGAVLMARVRSQAPSAPLITQGSLASIVVNLTDMRAASTSILTPVIATSVYDSLQQNDPRWQVDGPNFLGPDKVWGYNFAYTVPAASLTPAAPPTSYPPAELTDYPYQADAVFTDVAANVFRIVYRFNAIQVYA